MKPHPVTKCSKRLPLTKTSKPNIKPKDSTGPVVKKFSKPNKLVKSTEALNSVNKSNYNNLKSKSVQNLSDIKNDFYNTNAIKKHSVHNLNETKKNTSSNSKNVDALKILEFLVQKTKQNSDSKNVTFDSLFNELNQMNKNLASKVHLESSLDIKLDQMENEIEILRAQLNQNSHFSAKCPIKMTKPDESKKFFELSAGDKIQKLQKELNESNKKCKTLEHLLEKKNKQAEKFNFLFK